jgi:hypothetical protein
MFSRGYNKTLTLQGNQVDKLGTDVYKYTKKRYH